ncbi:SURF2 Surfeit locus protein 2 [Eggerthella guodeyinii]|uniref:SURF2 Surfeit locus protein 2 n=1 Tax=Eggerthella guodeyinii TaxID=2690837 RepID=A0A6L7IWC1_9ACTN|nr:SURF2 Surfeit locus protein 2 [Eggerthella guodeyinii]QOS69465.1 SURF2 Surfeit locus protein 2 [Eggerthella guodeyinii]
MAAGDPKFSHITVTPDDEDDVVIQAGARPARTAAPTAAPTPVPAPAPTALGADDAVVEPDDAATEEPEAVEEREEPSAEDEGFQGTTLDDLEAAPMPIAQKIVLALGAVAVIAVVAWYLFLR